VTDDTSEKDDKGQKALGECSQGLTCLILLNNFKSYFKFCYKWVYHDHEQENQNITEKRKDNKDEDIERRKTNTISESYILLTD